MQRARVEIVRKGGHFPEEIWTQIFERVSEPHDLCQLHMTEKQLAVKWSDHTYQKPLLMTLKEWHEKNFRLRKHASSIKAGRLINYRLTVLDMICHIVEGLPSFEIATKSNTLNASVFHLIKANTQMRLRDLFPSPEDGQQTQTFSVVFTQKNVLTDNEKLLLLEIDEYLKMKYGWCLCLSNGQMNCESMKVALQRKEVALTNVLYCSTKIY